MKRVLTLTALSAVLVLGMALLWSPLRAEDLPSPAIGAAAPDFSLPDENGHAHSLTQYRGKAVVLEWTNPDCPYVQRHYEHDTMEKLATALGAKGVVWLAVNSTYDNTPAQTIAWRQEQGFEYATLQDPAGKVGRSYGARTTPHMYVVDGKGILRYAGAIDDDPRGRKPEPQNYVDGAIGSLLAGARPDPSATEPYGCSVKYSKN